MILDALATAVRWILPDLGDAMTPMTPDHARPASQTPAPPQLDTTSHDIEWWQDQHIATFRRAVQAEAERDAALRLAGERLELIRNLEAEIARLQAWTTTR